MKNGELISVIMSTKDTDLEMLSASVNSILNQTYDNFELIIVCDGSDNDYNYLCQINDNRIKLIKHDVSIGLTKSLNECLKIAKGKYIARMDSDDISLKNRLKIEVEYLEKYKNIDICSTYAQTFGSFKKIITGLFKDHNGIKAQLFISNCLVHPATMIRRSFLLNNNIQYNEDFKYSQDYELWNRCSRLTKFAIIPKVCLLYRMHDKQISTAKSDEQNALCSKIYESNLKFLGLEANEYNINILLSLSGKLQSKISYDECLDFIRKILLSKNVRETYNIIKLKNVLFLNLLKRYKKKSFKTMCLCPGLINLCLSDFLKKNKIKFLNYIVGITYERKNNI